MQYFKYFSDIYIEGTVCGLGNEMLCYYLQRVMNNNVELCSDWLFHTAAYFNFLMQLYIVG